MKIHPVSTGNVRVKRNQIHRPKGLLPPPLPVFTGREWSDWLPVYAWVIEHPEGVIVVDTGETSRTGTPGYLPTWHPYYRWAVRFDVAPAQEIGPQLRLLGVDPQRDVRRVVLTHLHTDHAGGLWHFPNSEIHVDRREYRASRGLAGQLAGYLPHRMPPWLAPRYFEWKDGAFGPFARSEALTTDGRVRAVPTPGHSPGHTSVVVEDDGLFFFLAGDTSYTEENLLSGIPDGVGTGPVTSTLATIRRFAAERPTVYLPSHDPEAARRLARQIIIPQTDKSHSPAAGREVT